MLILPRLPGTPVPIHSAIAVIQSDGGERDDVEMAAHLCIGLAVKAHNIVVVLGFLQREPLRLKLAACGPVALC